MAARRVADLPTAEPRFNEVYVHGADRMLEIAPSKTLRALNTEPILPDFRKKFNPNGIFFINQFGMLTFCVPIRLCKLCTPADSHVEFMPHKMTTEGFPVQELTQQLIKFYGLGELAHTSLLRVLLSVNTVPVEADLITFKQAHDVRFEINVFAMALILAPRAMERLGIPGPRTGPRGEVPIPVRVTLHQKSIDFTPALQQLNTVHGAGAITATRFAKRVLKFEMPKDVMMAIDVLPEITGLQFEPYAAASTGGRRRSRRSRRSKQLRRNSKRRSRSVHKKRTRLT